MVSLSLVSLTLSSGSTYHYAMVVDLLSKQARARAYGQARAMLLLLCSVIVVGFAWFGLWYVAK